jgi:hypothetical protein
MAKNALTTSTIYFGDTISVSTSRMRPTCSDALLEFEAVAGETLLILLSRCLRALDIARKKDRVLISDLIRIRQYVLE